MAFKKNPKVTTSADPGTDKTLPKTGSNIPLNVIQLKQQIIEFVDGDVYRTVNGDVTYEVRGDLETTITKNETHNVTGNRSTTISGDHDETICGNRTCTNCSPVTTTHLASHIETFVGENVKTHTSEEQNEKILGIWEWKPTEMVVIGFKQENVGIALEYGVVGVGLRTIGAEGVMFKQTSKLLDGKLEGISDRLHGIDSKIAAAVPKVAAEINALVYLAANSVCF